MGSGTLSCIVFGNILFPSLWEMVVGWSVVKSRYRTEYIDVLRKVHLSAIPARVRV
jgi:hypothetical protein